MNGKKGTILTLLVYFVYLGLCFVLSYFVFSSNLKTWAKWLIVVATCIGAILVIELTYIVRNVLFSKWLKDMKQVAKINERNIEKAKLLDGHIKSGACDEKRGCGDWCDINNKNSYWTAMTNLNNYKMFRWIRIKHYHSNDAKFEAWWRPFFDSWMKELDKKTSELEHQSVIKN